MKFYIPWTPVPITGQVFFVLAAAVVLGRHFGGLSQLIYTLVGVVGIPWFAGSNANPVRLFEGLPGLYQGLGGIAILYGATFGYIIGFIVAARVIGWAVDSRIRFRRYLHLTPLLLGEIAIIYVIGAVWFYFWWTADLGFLEVRGGLSLIDLLFMTVIPFIPLDVVKAATVVAIGGFLLPKRSYGMERDA